MLGMQFVYSNEALREDKLYFSNADAIVCIPTKYTLKVAERITSYKPGDIRKMAFIEAREYECRK